MSNKMLYIVHILFIIIVFLQNALNVFCMFYVNIYYVSVRLFIERIVYGYFKEKDTTIIQCN